MEQLLKLIRALYPISQAFEDRLRQLIKREEVKKKQWLLQPGEISNRLFFIEKGLVRGFYINQDKETTVWILQENDIVISVVSFYLRQPSVEYIEMLEDGIIWSLTYDQVQRLYHDFSEFNYVGRIVTERYYTLSERRTYTLRMRSAQERYQQLLTDIPDIFSRVPLKFIASLLDLTPETVSRIRAKKL